MNLNFSRSGVKTLITNNPKVVFWSGVGSLVLTAISVGGSIWLYRRKKKCDTESDMAKSINDGAIAIKKIQVSTNSDLVKAIQDGEIATRKKRVDTECDILATTAKTACKIMEQATAVVPELKALKAEVIATQEEMKAMKEAMKELNKPTDSGADSDEESDMTLNGRSSVELFNRPRTEYATWVVDGYMKVDQVNLIVAGSGVGKTNLMVQIALAVAKGTRPEFLPEDCSVSVRQSVKYYRLEDFGDEFEGKYGNGKVLHNSSIEWFLSEDLPSSTLVGLVEHIKALADSLTEDTVVFIDPATKLDGYKHTEFIKGVEEAMAIAKARNVTLTIIGTVHLDEIKDWSVLTNCDIKGGDKGLQQAGSVTALRRERTNVEEYRFLQCLKEPKGSPKPFNGDVLVMKKVHEQLDDSNKYLYYQYESIKPEVQARPEKPKAQTDGVCSTEASSEAPMAPNQKVTTEVECKIHGMLQQGMKPKIIAKKIGLSEKTIRRYKKKLA